jgi:hypothetical protein
MRLSVLQKDYALREHTDIAPESVAQISSALTVLLANIRVLYVKTRTFIGI